MTRKKRNQLADIQNQVELTARIKLLEHTFKHGYVAEYDSNDKITRDCKACGLDFMDLVHFRVQEY